MLFKLFFLPKYHRSEMCPHIKECMMWSWFFTHDVNLDHFVKVISLLKVAAFSFVTDEYLEYFEAVLLSSFS